MWMQVIRQVFARFYSSARFVPLSLSWLLLFFYLCVFRFDGLVIDSPNKLQELWWSMTCRGPCSLCATNENLASHISYFRLFETEAIRELSTSCKKSKIVFASGNDTTWSSILHNRSPSLPSLEIIQLKTVLAFNMGLFDEATVVCAIECLFTHNA